MIRNAVVGGQVGCVRLLPGAPPPGDTVSRVGDLVPEMFERVTGYIDKKTAGESGGRSPVTPRPDKAGWSRPYYSHLTIQMGVTFL